MRVTTVENQTGFSNKAYEGIYLEKDKEYKVEFFARCVKFNGTFSVLIEKEGVRYAEAAFLTGIERNADVVVLASYAPLFARIGYSQWSPDMIWFDGSASYVTPSYYVQKMYAENMGDVTLDTFSQEKKLQRIESTIV